MSRFARPSDWLRQLFIPSRTGWQPPSVVAEEVSLVQPYDGGGFAIWPVGQWILEETQAAAAAGNASVLLNTNEEFTRILALAVHISAGVLAEVFWAIQGPTATNVVMTERRTLAVVGQAEAFTQTTPILPPGHDLRIAWNTGDAATVVVARAIICTVPIGSVFYV